MAEKCECGGTIVGEAAVKRHNCFSNIPFWGTMDIVEYNVNRIARRYCIECNEEYPV